MMYSKILFQMIKRIKDHAVLQKGLDINIPATQKPKVCPTFN